MVRRAQAGLAARLVSGFFANANSFSGGFARSALRGTLPVRKARMGSQFVTVFNKILTNRRKEQYLVNRSEMPGHARDHECWNEVEQRLVAEPAEPQDSPPELAPVRSDGRGLQLRRRVQEARLQSAEEGPPRADDGQPGLVAGGFRPLRGALHSHGVAQRRAPTASAMDAAARAPANSASRRSTPGRTTRTSTRRAGCFGRSSRNTAGKSPGPT